jgi:CheY-like chemotaxis protein
MAEKLIHLLHIEDDSVDRMVVKRVLQKFPVVASNYHAQNGVEALDMLRGANGQVKLNPFPDVILLDINMPKMNGIEFLKELRADEQLRRMPAFVLTTSSDEGDRKNAHFYNVAGYIIKPVDITVFESTFRMLTEYWLLCELK